MAKYSKKAGAKVEKVMHEFKEGTLKSGKDGKGGKVKSREQAIAIGLSEAREKGAKVPKKASASSPKKAASRKAPAKKVATKTPAKKAASRKAPAKKTASKKAASK